MSDARNELELLIAHERAQLVPQDGATEAGWAALQRRLADKASPIVDIPPPAGATSGHLGKVLVGLGVLGLLAFAFVLDRHDAPDSTGSVSAPPSPRETPIAGATAWSPRPRTPAPTLPAAGPPAQPPATPDPVPVPEPRRAKKSVPEPQRGGLEDELRILESAKAALNRKDADGALVALRRHEADFPRGLFVEERRAMRVEALCAAGRTEDGRREQTRFSTRYPNSPFIDRVQGACAP